jgi:hypothetical protein
MTAFEIFQIVFTVTYGLFVFVSGLYISWLISLRNLFVFMFVAPFAYFIWCVLLVALAKPLGWFCC